MTAPCDSLFRRFALSFLVFSAFSGPATAAFAQTTPATPDPRIGQVIGVLEKTRTLHQTALSPNGQMVAWVVSAEGGTEIEVAPTADPAKARRITAGSGATCTEENLAWSPKGDLAFTSDCNAAAGATGQADVYLVTPTAASASPRRLTHLHGGISSLAFSPDGLHIGCLYIAGATRPAGALAAMKPPSGVIGVEGLEVQRVAAIEAASGEFRLVSPAMLHVYEYDWAPDSRQFVYTAAAPPGENNWWIAQLYTQPLAAGTAKSILAPEQTPGSLHGLQIAVPRWSPDGTQIAFIGGLMSDQGATGGDIYVMAAAGGEPRNITPGGKKSAVWIDWRKPGSGAGGTACCASPELLV
jgi:Tol biopolymer transport system component